MPDGSRSTGGFLDRRPLLADDLAALTAKLDLNGAIRIGHSTGGGEVARYIGRPGAKVSQCLRDSFWLREMPAGVNADLLAFARS